MHPPALYPEHTPRLADRLAAARRGRFVGRLAELDRFSSALLSDEPPFAVLHVCGPGGVGKSTLLREYARVASDAARPVVSVDGRDIDPSPPSLLLALREAIGGGEGALSVEHWPANGVWLIDTYEMLTPLDSWLRETFLPQLPARSMVVLAGRHPPTPAWRTDLDWAGLTQTIALGNLRPEESQTYLATRGIDAEHHADVLAFTRGHPLALALIADLLSGGEKPAALDAVSEPDIVRVLLERLVRDVPTPAHRLALETCVLVWATTETLLADVFGATEAYDLFAWLRRQSFIEQGLHGLFPHDLARDVLDADLRWRNPGGRQELIRRLAVHLYARFHAARGREQQRVWFDLLYLNRQNPFFRPFFEWTTLGHTYAEPALAADHAAILEMTRRHQGDAGARIAQHWLSRQPEAFLVYRDVAGEVFGYMAHLALYEVSPEDAAADPAVPAALAFAARHGPPRPGEEIGYLRFWMHRDAYQGVSPAVNLTAINSSIYWTSHPNLAWNFIAIADPEFFAPHFTSIHMWRSPEADFEVDGQHFGVFAHDWRVEPAAAWMTIKHELASMTETNPAPPTPPRATRVLTQSEFAAAVRQALRDYTRPDRLATNPLARTRLVGDGGEAKGVPARLQAQLGAAVALLAADPKSTKLHRALWHTYIEPAPTQEQAAELLDLPFNTYRYHLAKGIARVTDALWRRELGDTE